MPGDIFLHIGAPKTASTTMQRRVFARHPQIYYLGEGGDGWEDPADAAVIERMIFADDLFLQGEESASLFEAQRVAAGNRTFIYSNGDIMTSRRPSSCARRFHEVLPDARIIIVLRNQFTALASYWANHGAFLKPAPPSHFCRYVELDDWLAWGSLFPEETPFANFRYDEIVGLYASLWGRDRIHLMLFEDFIAAPDAFIRNLSMLLGIDGDQAVVLAKGGHERKRNSARALAWHRFYSRYLWGCMLPSSLPGRETILASWRHFLNAGPPVNVKIQNIWCQRLMSVYALGNARLATDWGLDLARHGYPLSTASSQL